MYPNSPMPNGCNPKLSLDKVKKQTVEVQKENLEVQAACVDVDNKDVEASEFMCTLVSDHETACTSLALNSGSQKLLMSLDAWISDTGAT